MTTKVIVQFEVVDPAAFQDRLLEHFRDDNTVTFRTDADPSLRAPLQQFAAAMEKKLIKNDHKRSWRELPVDALLR